MENNELYHYGILGMRWGVRRTPAQLGRSTTGKKTASSKSNNKNASSTSKQSNKKSVKDMTDDELKSKINRLELEKRYKDLSFSDSSKGKVFTKQYLADAGKKILVDTAVDVASQAVKHVIVKKVNEKFNVRGEKGELIDVVFTNNKRK